MVLFGSFRWLGSKDAFEYMCLRNLIGKDDFQVPKKQSHIISDAHSYILLAAGREWSMEPGGMLWSSIECKSTKVLQNKDGNLKIE
jgi:hypothetical protein